MDKKQSTSLKFDWTHIVEPHPRNDPPAEMMGCASGGGTTIIIGGGGSTRPDPCRGPVYQY